MFVGIASAKLFYDKLLVYEQVLDTIKSAVSWLQFPSLLCLLANRHELHNKSYHLYCKTFSCHVKWKIHQNLGAVTVVIASEITNDDFCFNRTYESGYFIENTFVINIGYIYKTYTHETYTLYKTYTHAAYIFCH
jgi:hypothetical protein